LGMFAEDGSDSAETRLSLFRDSDAMQAFGDRMEQDFALSPPSERVDLGIAFLEMGLCELAIRHFQGAVDKLTREAPVETDSLLAATGLVAYAMIQGGRAFDATIVLQPLLNDAEIERARKLDLIYLMGRAFEVLGRLEAARSWYQQAAEIEPHYRDTDERLRKPALR
jgi:tetratricopeptide (TPR) repeat protein